MTTQRYDEPDLDDSGSALILVLMVVLFAGLVTGAVLDFAGVGLRIAPQARDTRNQSSYLQGAVDGAISSIRGSTSVGTVGGPACPTFVPPVPSGLPGATGKVFSVSCSPLTVTGGGAGAADQPNFAVLTLGTGTDGLTQTSGNNVLAIDGGVYSHGVVTGPSSPHAALQVNGSIYANGACSGTVTSTDPFFSFAHSCNVTPPGTFGDDPQYVSAVSGPAALTSLIGADTTALQALGADPIPTCSGGYLNFVPGYYSVTPDELKDAYASGCSSSYAFGPGAYYFNYAGTWSIGSAIAGTRSGTTCDQNAPGSQFVFGGASRVLIGHGALEICAPLQGQVDAATGLPMTGLPQRIAVYGLGASNPNNPTSVPVAQSTTLITTATPTSGAAGGLVPFASPGSAGLIGDSLAATVTLPEKSGAQLHYSAFGSVPKGSTITSVKARLVYSAASALSATLTADTSTSAPATSATPDSCAAGCLVDLTSFVAGSAGVTWRDLDQLTLDLAVTTGKNQTGAASVDGIELQVTYVAPALAAQTCPASCDFFV
ncbi:MAG: hypothetical protein JWN31_150, partial [Frankiales bacterium]|nr:hypothetical protein [Frankiales bacterium]